jgi:hypothetical protein
MSPALARRIRNDVVAVLAGREIVARIRDLASEPGGEAPSGLPRRREHSHPLLIHRSRPSLDDLGNVCCVELVFPCEDSVEVGP